MRNKTGKPYAFAELGADGYWQIYFDPSPKLDGYFYYECLQGPIDGGNADKIVDLLNDEPECDGMIPEWESENG